MFTMIACNLISKWWKQRDSNPRPPACKAGALPTELCPHDWQTLCRCGNLEEYIGIEPTPPVWKTGILTAIRILHGVPDRNRTCNLLITKQLLCLLSYRSMMAVRILPLLWKRIGEAFCKRLGDLYGNRTHVTAVKGPCLDRLTNRPYKDRLFPVCHGCMQPFTLHMPSCCTNAAVTFGRLARC